MKRTYGQIVDGKTLTYNEFLKAVQSHLQKVVGKSGDAAGIKKLYNKGYSIEDTCSSLILNAK